MRLWEPFCGVLLASFPRSASDIVALAFSPDGATLGGAGSFSGEVKLWNVATARELPSLKSPDRLSTSLAFAPNGQTIIAGYGATSPTRQSDGMIQYWDMASGQERTRLEQHTQGVTCLSLSPDGTLLASGGPDGNVRLWQTPEGVSSRQVASDGFVRGSRPRGHFAPVASWPTFRKAASIWARSPPSFSPEIASRRATREPAANGPSSKSAAAAQ